MSQQPTTSRDATYSRQTETDDVSQHDTPSTPIRHSMNPKHSKFLSSSSLKRKKFKPIHCHYCSRIRCTRSQIEQHFAESQLCMSLYMRE